MKCKDCPANNEGDCLIKRKSRMLVSGSYGCDAQKKNVEKRLGIYKQTNADRIRAMSDGELAKFISNCINGELWRIQVGVPSQKLSDWMDWLRQEAEE